MADPNTRTGKRTPVTLKIKFKSETIEQFIERYAVDVSQGGIFIRTKEPLPVGTQMKFEFQLRDASPLIAGEGTVVWTRENDPSRPAIAPGMGVRFDRLAEGSPSVLERILAEKSKQQPARNPAETTKPPMFTDTPTRVAPAPVQDMLGSSGRPTRARADSEQTPLPKPMPFHSDAEDFPEEAFEEATKVRSLDELVAQTAQTDAGDPARDLFGGGPAAGGAIATTIIPPDELAMRRQQARMDTTLDEPGASGARLEPPPEVNRDSAPGLPSPPSVEPARAPRLLDTSPSPRSEALSTDLAPSKTRIGLEPAKVDTKPGVGPVTAAHTAQSPLGGAPPSSAAAAAMAGAAARPAAATTPPRTRSQPSTGQVRPITEEPVRPVKASSVAPIVIAVIAVVAAAAAAVWFFVLKDSAEEASQKATVATPTPTPVPPPTPDLGSAAAVDPNGGSAAPGSAAVVVTPGSAGSGTSTPGVKTVETIVAASADHATVTFDAPAISGPAPFTAKLEPGKIYKAHVSAPGYATLDLDVKGGQTGLTAKLVAKPKLLLVSSNPPGAQILVEGEPIGHVTPFEVDLGSSKSFLGKGKVKVTLRKAGFRQMDQVVDVSAPGDAKLMMDATLLIAPVVRPPAPRPPTPGSAAGTPDTGGGSAATPEPPTPTPTPTPPPQPPPSGEPEPDFAK